MKSFISLFLALSFCHGVQAADTSELTLTSLSYGIVIGVNLALLFTIRFKLGNTINKLQFGMSTVYIVCYALFKKNLDVYDQDSTTQVRVAAASLVIAEIFRVEMYVALTNMIRFSNQRFIFIISNLGRLFYTIMGATGIAYSVIYWQDVMATKATLQVYSIFQYLTTLITIILGIAMMKSIYENSKILKTHQNSYLLWDLSFCLLLELLSVIVNLVYTFILPASNFSFTIGAITIAFSTLGLINYKSNVVKFLDSNLNRSYTPNLNTKIEDKALSV